MFINFEILNKSELTWKELEYLFKLKVDYSLIDKDFHVKIVENLPSYYFTYIQGKPKEEMYQKIRISKKGEEFLENITTPHLLKEDIALFDRFSTWYLSIDERRSIGNKKKTKMYISQFRQLVGLTSMEMAKLLYEFCMKEDYTLIMEYVFFVPNENRYGKFINNIESSKLHIFYEKYKDSIFKKN
jgi:hypothetical protein